MFNVYSLVLFNFEIIYFVTCANILNKELLTKPMKSHVRYYSTYYYNGRNQMCTRNFEKLSFVFYRVFQLSFSIYAYFFIAIVLHLFGCINILRVRRHMPRSVQFISQVNYSLLGINVAIMLDSRAAI